MRITLCALLLLAGCETTASYGNMLDAWTGSSESELVQAWGKPSGVYEAGAARFLTYIRERSVYVPGAPPSVTATRTGGAVTSVSQIPGTPSRNVDMRCVTTFELRDAKVVSSRWEGNDCKAAKQ